MPDHPLDTELPPDAPRVGEENLGWADMLVALTGLVLVAIAAFSLFGAQPQGAQGLVETSQSPQNGGALVGHAVRADAPTLGA
jgi:hypothetical protein